MSYEKFTEHTFLRSDGMELLRDLKSIRDFHGPPHRLRILRNIVRTRPFCRTVKPEGWRWQ